MASNGEDSVVGKVPFSIEAVDVSSPDAAQREIDREVERLAWLDGFDEPIEAAEMRRLQAVLPPNLTQLNDAQLERFVRQVRMTLWAGDALDAMLELSIAEEWREWLAQFLSLPSTAGDRAFVETFTRRLDYMRELEIAAGYFDEPKPKVTLH